MAGAKDGKTEKPTTKRLTEARRQGQMAKSPELAAWCGVLVGAHLVPIIFAKGDALTTGLFATGSDLMRAPSAAGDLRLLATGLAGVARIVFPVMVGMAAIGVLVSVAQTRGALATASLKPSLSRISLSGGLRRLWSPQSLWGTAKSVVRIAALAYVGWRSIKAVLRPLLGGGALNPFAAAAIGARTAISMVQLIAAISVGIAVADYLWQRRTINNALKMAKHEIKEEARQSDGNPVIRGEIRRRARRMSRQRMIAAIANADTLVVNPTHVAVALKYEPGRRAPRVVAKGADELALRLRLEAEIHGVPLVRDVPLARAIYGACDLGQEIPRELYEAVAKLLTFLYSLRAAGKVRRIDGGPHTPLASFLPGGGSPDAPADDEDDGDDAAVRTSGGPARRRGAPGDRGRAEPVALGT